MLWKCAAAGNRELACCRRHYKVGKQATSSEFLRFSFKFHLIKHMINKFEFKKKYNGSTNEKYLEQTFPHQMINYLINVSKQGQNSTQQ